MNEALRVLVPEDNESDALLLVRELARQGYDAKWRRVETREEMRDALLAEEWDVILSDYNMPGFSALGALELLREMKLDIPLIVISGAIGEEVAVQAMRSGARDYLMKGELERLGEAVRRERGQWEVREEQRRTVVKLRHLNRTLKALRSIRALKAGEDTERIRHSAATMLVKDGAYASAALVWTDVDGGDAQLCYADRDTATSRAKEEELRRHGPPACLERVRTEGGVTLSGEIEECTECPYRDRLTGSRHLVSRLQVDEEELGLIVVGLPGAIGADQEEVGIFREVAGDIGMVIHHNELGERRRRSEDRYAHLFNTMAQGVVYEDRSGTIIEANPAAETILGVCREEMIGRSNDDPRWRARREDHSDFPAEEHPTMMALRTGRPASGVMCVHNPREDEDRWISVAAVPQFPPGGDQPHQVFTVFSDITPLKVAEETLRAQQRELDHVLETMPEALIQTDLDRRIKRVNQGFVRMFGYEQEEVLGKETAIIYADPAAFRTAGEARYAVGLPPNRAPYEVLYRRKDGSVFPSETVGGPIDGGHGEPVGFLGLVRDITDRKKAEEEERRLEAKLAQSMKMESVGRLAGGVAHDFNNALAVILLNAEILLAGCPEDDLRRHDLLEIHSAAKKSANLTRQLLAFARKETIRPEVICLDEEVETNLKMLRRLIGEHIDLQWLPDCGGKSVLLDPTQLDQLLVNLLVNARDAIQGGGRVTVETRQVTLGEEECQRMPDLTPGSFLVLAVSDDGAGMDPGTLEQVFDPFFTTKGSEDGTGLGLATVYGIVKQNGGLVNVYSEPGLGSTFKLYLPEHRGAGGEQLHGTTAADDMTGSEVILIVEDQAEILKVAKRILEGLGYTVLGTDQPASAAGLCKEHDDPVDLLITDVVMPQMNGRELAEKLCGVYPEMAVLFISGYTADVMSKTGILEADVNFLAKPFTKGELARAVRAALDAARRVRHESR